MSADADKSITGAFYIGGALASSPLKRYLYTSFLFFLGMSMIAGVGVFPRRLEANSTPGEQDLPCSSNIRTIRSMFTPTLGACPSRQVLTTRRQHLAASFRGHIAGGRLSHLVNAELSALQALTASSSLSSAWGPPAAGHN